MLKVVESFAGIGSQHKALTRLKQKEVLDFEIINIIEWDIYAILAYDLIHNGEQIKNPHTELDKLELMDKLEKYSLSLDGKNLVTYEQLFRFSEEALKKLLFALERNNNLTNIKEVKSKDFDERIDVFTYSFPCQDLSLSGYFHGDKGGISRNAENSSSMLWEVERILYDFKNNDIELPKSLLMENVASITSKKHIDHFNDWKESLNELGYVSQEFCLCAENFGIPQKRKRAFMISLFAGHEEGNRLIVKNILKEKIDSLLSISSKTNPKILESFLRLDYNNEVYLKEAKEQVPNFTKSREKIYDLNLKINNVEQVVDKSFVRTLTTKQDRHPNSGIIHIDKKKLDLSDNKSNYRFITPRESFLLMGFDEFDYDIIINNNIDISNTRSVFTNSRLTKMAGNSIVVQKLEEVFKIINELLNMNKIV